MTPDLILLDCDGVIVDTEPTTNGALSKNLSKYGLQKTPEECIDLFVGGTMVGVGETVRGLGYALPDDWIDEIYTDMFNVLKQGVATYPDLFTFLDLADDMGIPLCVLSNGPMDKMKITLGQHGLWDRFGDRIYSGYSNANPKPDPGMLIEAMERFDAHPERTWMVDDSKNGITAGIRAGMETFAFVPEGMHLPAAKYDHRVYGYADLIARLRG